MTAMKQPTKPFSFKQNADVKALPEAVPPPPVSTAPAKRAKLGRPASTGEGPRNRHVATYLTEDEHARFFAKLDGRVPSVIIRRLILDYINHD